MLIAILLILIVLWFLGYGPIQALHIPLLKIGPRTVNLWDIIIFVVILWLIDALPRPFREIAAVVFIIWLLSLFGIIAIAGLSNILLIATIVGLGLYIISGK